MAGFDPLRFIGNKARDLKSAWNELLHPRGPDGRFIRKWGMSKPAATRVLDTIFKGQTPEFRDNAAAGAYARAQHESISAPFDRTRYRLDYDNANVALAQHQTDPTTQRFDTMMQGKKAPAKDDLIVTVPMRPEQLGLRPDFLTPKPRPELAEPGEDPPTFADVDDLTGGVFSTGGYTPGALGDVTNAPEPIKLIVATPKGTPMVWPGNGTSVDFDKGQKFRVTNVEHSGSQAFVYAVAVPNTDGDTARLLRPSDEAAQAARAAQAPGARNVGPEAVPPPPVGGYGPTGPARPEAPANMPGPGFQQPQPGPQGRTDAIAAPAVGGAPGVAPQAAPTPSPQTFRPIAMGAKLVPPSEGRQRNQWMRAFQGATRANGDPEMALRTLERDITDNNADLAQNPSNDRLRGDIADQEKLADLISEHFGFERNAPAKAPEATPQAPNAPEAPAAGEVSPAIRQVATAPAESVEATRRAHAALEAENLKRLDEAKAKGKPTKKAVTELAPEHTATRDLIADRLRSGEWDADRAAREAEAEASRLRGGNAADERAAGFYGKFAEDLRAGRATQQLSEAGRARKEISQLTDEFAKKTPRQQAKYLLDNNIPRQWWPQILRNKDGDIDQERLGSVMREGDAIEKAGRGKKVVESIVQAGGVPKKGSIVEWRDDTGKTFKGEILTRPRNGLATVQWDGGRKETGVDLGSTNVRGVRDRNEGEDITPGEAHVTKAAPVKKAAAPRKAAPAKATAEKPQTEAQQAARAAKARPDSVADLSDDEARKKLSRYTKADLESLLDNQDLFLGRDKPATRTGTKAELIDDAIRNKNEIGRIAGPAPVKKAAKAAAPAPAKKAVPSPERTRRIQHDAAEAGAKLAADLEENITKGASDEAIIAIARRAQRRFGDNPDAQHLAALAREVEDGIGDRPALLKAIRSRMGRQGLKPIAVAGEEVTYDPAIHTPMRPLPEGTPVRVVHPGYSWRTPEGTTETVLRPLVQDTGVPAKKAVPEPHAPQKRAAERIRASEGMPAAEREARAQAAEAGVKIPTNLARLGVTQDQMRDYNGLDRAQKMRYTKARNELLDHDAALTRARMTPDELKAEAKEAARPLGPGERMWPDMVKTIQDGLRADGQPVPTAEEIERDLKIGIHDPKVTLPELKEVARNEGVPGASSLRTKAQLRDAIDAHRARGGVPEVGMEEAPRAAEPLSTPRASDFTEAWRKQRFTLKDPETKDAVAKVHADLTEGRITPEQAIRSIEGNIASNNDRIGELDAHLRRLDLAPDERVAMEKDLANLEHDNGVLKKASTFTRKHFTNEPVITKSEEPEARSIALKQMETLVPEGERKPFQEMFDRDSAKDREAMREAGRLSGLPSLEGDTTEELFTDALRKTMEKALGERQAGKKPRKVAPKVEAPEQAPGTAHATPQVRDIAAGLTIPDRYLDDIQKDLDNPKITPASIGRKIEDWKGTIADPRTGPVYAKGVAADDVGVPEIDESRAARRPGLKADLDRAQHEWDQLQELANRLKKIRRSRATAPRPKPVELTPEERADVAKAADLAEVPEATVAKRVLDRKEAATPVDDWSRGQADLVRTATSQQGVRDLMKTKTAAEVKKIAKAVTGKDHRTRSEAMSALERDLMDRIRGDQVPQITSDLVHVRYHELVGDNAPSLSDLAIQDTIADADTIYKTHGGLLSRMDALDRSLIRGYGPKGVEPEGTTETAQVGKAARSVRRTEALKPIDENVALHGDPEGDNMRMHGDSLTMGLAQEYAKAGRNNSANRMMDIRRRATVAPGREGPRVEPLTPQQVVDELKTLRAEEQDPVFQRRIDRAIAGIDAPMTDLPEIPANTPPVLRKLLEDVHAIPYARKKDGDPIGLGSFHGPSLEEQVAQAIRDAAAGSRGESGRAGEERVRKILRDQTHEINEASFRLWDLGNNANEDRAIRSAFRDLEKSAQAPRAPEVTRATKTMVNPEPIPTGLRMLVESKFEGRDAVLARQALNKLDSALRSGAPAEEIQDLLGKLRPYLDRSGVSEDLAKQLLDFVNSHLQ